MTKRSINTALSAALLMIFTLGMSSPVQDGIQEGSAAPEFEITADNGDTYSIKSMTKDAPAFIVFWKESCPHNRRAAGFFNSLGSAYGEKANLVGVVSAPDDRISDWAEEFSTSYPLLPDGAKSVIDAYDVSQSIVTYQIGTDGKIAKIFGGYGFDAMSALNQAMAEAAGVDAAEVDLSSAPTRTTYG
ncbi:peroxiredoxin family protein [Gemmatimonadota bacterium]